MICAIRRGADPPSRHRTVLLGGCRYGRQRQRTVEGDKPTAVAHRQREQVGVGDLPRPVQPAAVHDPWGRAASRRRGRNSWSPARQAAPSISTARAAGIGDSDSGVG